MTEMEKKGKRKLSNKEKLMFAGGALYIDFIACRSI